MVYGIRVSVSGNGANRECIYMVYGLRVSVSGTRVNREYIEYMVYG